MFWDESGQPVKKEHIVRRKGDIGLPPNPKDLLGSKKQTSKKSQQKIKIHNEKPISQSFKLQTKQKKMNESNHVLQPFLQNLRRKGRPMSLFPYEENEGEIEESSSTISKISDHYKQIQVILQNENNNLKEHNEYLIKVIGNLQQKQRQYKLKMSEYKERIHELEKNQKLHSLQMNKMNKLLVKMEAFIEELGQNKDSEEKISSYDIKNSEERLSIQINGDSITPHQSTEHLENLNDKCDALLYEYKKTKNPNLRKECIKLIKEIKEKKVGKNGEQKRNHHKKGSNIRKSREFF